LSIKIVLAPYKDPAYGLDWPEQTPIIIKEVAEHLSNYPEGKIEYKTKETDHGIGADWPTITFEIISIAGLVFFGIPALHKKIRETLSEWKKIKQNFDKLVDWIQKKNPCSLIQKNMHFSRHLSTLSQKPTFWTSN